MKLTYFENPDGTWTFGFKRDGKVVWRSPKKFVDAFEAAKGATEFYADQINKEVL